MGKDKLRKFRENLTFACFVQPDFDEVFRHDHPLKGHWGRDFFHNDRPIVLELGCGKGEYTVALSERDPSRNYIGVDIKGARMWRGAKTATERGMRSMRAPRAQILPPWRRRRAARTRTRDIRTRDTGRKPPARRGNCC